MADHFLRRPGLLALAILAGVGLWLLTGLGREPADGHEEKVVEKSLRRVQVTPMQAQEKELMVVLYGHTEAHQQVGLVAETEGHVTQIEAPDGSLLKKGDVILRIDERDRRARLSEAQARLKEATTAFEAAKKLKASEYRSQTAFEQAEARLEEARADLIQAQFEIDKTAVRAPFDGRLEQVHVERGSLVGAGFGPGSAVVATYVMLDPLLAVGDLTEQDHARVRSGAEAFVELIDGRRVEGKVTFVGTVAKPETRTFRVEVEIPNPDHELAAGMTASIHIPYRRVKAYQVPSSVLGLSSEEKLGVKTVDEHNQVQFHPVEIVEDAEGGIWITGLPPQIRLITLGHPFVNEGEEVIPVLPQNKGEQTPVPAPSASSQPAASDARAD